MVRDTSRRQKQRLTRDLMKSISADQNFFSHHEPFMGERKFLSKTGQFSQPLQRLKLHLGPPAGVMFFRVPSPAKQGSVSAMVPGSRYSLIN